MFHRCTQCADIAIHPDQGTIDELRHGEVLIRISFFDDVIYGANLQVRLIFLMLFGKCLQCVLQSLA